MDSVDTFYEMQVAGSKWVYVGNLFHEGAHDRFVEPKLFSVRVKQPEKIHLVNIGLTMLSAPGGDFDEDDTVFADIYSIDGRLTSLEGDRQGGPAGVQPHGGVWGRHFGDPGEVTAQGIHRNMGLSSYVGPVNREIVFRLFIQGDDWAGAGFTMLQLT